MSDTARNRMNELGANGTPFLFILDFDLKTPEIIPLEEVNPDEILYSVNDKRNYLPVKGIIKSPEIAIYPVEKNRYSKAFDLVQKHISHGDSFLLNLTMPSRVKTNITLKEVFYRTQAKYKLWFRDQFVVYSPEIFVQTRNNHIHSFPMKGTINANIPNAEKILIDNEKELAEHYTIVDLIRNDLSIVSKNVRVERFRYIDRVTTNRGALLQISSEIVGELESGFQSGIGDILFSMLPAGSISGAPKKKTVEVIKEAEKYERGFYTGIFGIFDGENIDSGVMIRFMENTPDGKVYKSGGGITSRSNMEEEYHELVDKIYIPVINSNK